MSITQRNSVSSVIKFINGILYITWFMSVMNEHKHIYKLSHLQQSTIFARHITETWIPTLPQRRSMNGDDGRGLRDGSPIGFMKHTVLPHLLSQYHPLTDRISMHATQVLHGTRFVGTCVTVGCLYIYIAIAIQDCVILVLILCSKLYKKHKQNKKPREIAGEKDRVIFLFIFKPLLQT